MNDPHSPQGSVPQLPRTAAAARAQGVTTYFSGAPCLRGHVTARRARNCTCVQCHNERNQDRRWRIKEAVRVASDQTPATFGDRIAASLYFNPSI